MAYTETTYLGIKKPVIGSNQPFETAVMNENWDKVDNVVPAVQAIQTAWEARSDELDVALNRFDIDSTDALSEFQDEADAALASIDSEAILISLEDQIDTRLDAVEANLLSALEDGFTVDGGTA